MNFKSVSVVKFPVDITWHTMLDHLIDVANKVEDLESITEMERANLSEDIIKVVNVWKARPKLPPMVARYIQPDMLHWTDSATWKESEKKIEWNIRSHHFPDELHCTGTTLFEPAMGGRGCKLTFSGSLEWRGKVLSTGVGMLDKTLAKAAEGVLSQVIPSNFRKITEVVGGYIEKSGG